MVIVTKHREPKVSNKLFYKAKCHKCEAEFIFSSDDIAGAERRLNGVKWISCPECANCIYWTNENCLHANIESITEEEYNKELDNIIEEKR